MTFKHNLVKFSFFSCCESQLLTIIMSQMLVDSFWIKKHTWFVCLNEIWIVASCSLILKFLSHISLGELKLVFHFFKKQTYSEFCLLFFVLDRRDCILLFGKSVRLRKWLQNSNPLAVFFLNWRIFPKITGVSLPCERPGQVGVSVFSKAFASGAPLMLAVSVAITVTIGGERLVVQGTEQMPGEALRFKRREIRCQLR